MDSKTTTMNISLPTTMKKWVETRTGHGRYANASDYVRDLIRHDQERQNSIAEFRSLVNEGLASGISTKTLDGIWAEAQAIAAKRLADT